MSGKRRGMVRIAVPMPGGAVGSMRVARDIAPETLAALEHMMRLAYTQFTKIGGDTDGRQTKQGDAQGPTAQAQ